MRRNKEEEKRIEKAARSREPREDGIPCGQENRRLTFAAKQAIISSIKESIVAQNDDEGAAPTKRGRVENLKPKTSASARGRLGGIATAQANQKRKLVSQVIASWMLKDHEVPSYNPTTGKVEYQTMTTDQLMDQAMVRVLSRGDAASGSMIKIIHEIDEGKLVNLPGLTLDLTPEQLQARIDELAAKRAKRGKK